MVYDNGGGTSIGGLTSGTTYYAIADSTGTVKLATTAANAGKGVAIDLTTAGSGSAQKLTIDTTTGVDNQIGAQKGLADKKAGESGTKSFNPATKMNLTANTIDLGVGHGLKTGDAVVYSKGSGTGAAAIGGLEDGTTYYVIAVGTTGTIKLATTAANATAGTAIDLTTAGTGTSHTLTAGTKGTGSAPEAPPAETSSGGISVAAAVGINLAGSSARAYIPDSGIITAGGIVTLSASNNTDASAKADGSATGSSSVGIGAAVAVNVPILKNEAYIGHNADIHAKGLVIEALMTDVKGDKTQNFGAEATSGASGSNVAIAGSLAFNIMDSQSTALVKSGAQVVLTGGDVRLSAENTTVSTAAARPAGEGAVSAGALGVGASVALNIANTVTVAELEDSAVLTGAHDLTYHATSDNTVTTTAKAGGAAGRQRRRPWRRHRPSALRTTTPAPSLAAGGLRPSAATSLPPPRTSAAPPPLQTAVPAASAPPSASPLA